MGFTEILTALFVVLRLTHEIDWSWWLVLLPEEIAVAFYLLVWFLTLIGVGVAFLSLVRQSRSRPPRF